MKLISFEIHGLLGREEPVGGTFKDGVNIITGKNGVGKTNILKLLWYVISGNILLALDEVPFKSVFIQTDLYSCRVNNLGNRTCKIILERDGTRELYEDNDDGEWTTESAEDQVNPILRSIGASVFLPTFRRIEGGFGLKIYARRGSGLLPRRERNEVEDALTTLARGLSNHDHQFIASISSVDINSMLLKKYADFSEKGNLLQQASAHDITSRIKLYFESDEDKTKTAAHELLSEIKQSIEQVEQDREAVMVPMEALRLQIEKIFDKRGIRFGSRLSFGDAAGAISSEHLSAGEKQMLSFIAYNAFQENCVFFIDEPEISLHVDWQRQLFPILTSQQSTNQFIVATHSPFIYAKYPDNEICVDADRGDAEG